MLEEMYAITIPTKGANFLSIGVEPTTSHGNTYGADGFPNWTALFSPNRNRFFPHWFGYGVGHG